MRLNHTNIYSSLSLWCGGDPTGDICTRLLAQAPPVRKHRRGCLGPSLVIFYLFLLHFPHFGHRGREGLLRTVTKGIACAEGGYNLPKYFHFRMKIYNTKGFFPSSVSGAARWGAPPPPEVPVCAARLREPIGRLLPSALWPSDASSAASAGAGGGDAGDSPHSQGERGRGPGGFPPSAIPLSLFWGGVGGWVPLDPQACVGRCQKILGGGGGGPPSLLRRSMLPKGGGPYGGGVGLGRGEVPALEGGGRAVQGGG